MKPEAKYFGPVTSSMAYGWGDTEDFANNVTLKPKFAITDGLVSDVWGRHYVKHTDETLYGAGKLAGKKAMR